MFPGKKAVRREEASFRLGRATLDSWKQAFALNRKFFLKDTGRKPAHLDKQFNAGQKRRRKWLPGQDSPIERIGAGSPATLTLQRCRLEIHPGSGFS